MLFITVADIRHNYIPEKRKFPGILCFRQQRSRRRRMFSSATQPPPPRHNFVVSAITFEGFKLRSSNLTHALLIQISRTSSIIDTTDCRPIQNGRRRPFCQKIKLRIDLKWPEMAAILSKIKKK